MELILRDGDFDFTMQKYVRKSGNGAHITMPANLIGAKVLVVILENPNAVAEEELARMRNIQKNEKNKEDLLRGYNDPNWEEE